ncbi:hypothetical protein GOBAR_DD33262 [Gossypium barbadense]|nr:hypothetical protein GOBAR_DD33262 [Gossypium barbadense]
MVNIPRFCKVSWSTIAGKKEEMRTLYTWLKLATLCFIYCFFFIAFAFAAPSPDVADCSLNFTSYPYLPSGNCIGENGKVILWGSISSHLCCRNALNALFQVLAVRANQIPDSIIFIGQDSWNQCNSPFPSQPLVSLHSCGFDNFYSGSSKCSNLSLSQIQGSPPYLEAVKLCSDLSSSFDNTCKNCTDAIEKVAESLLALVQRQKDHTERTLCSLAAVLSVAAANVTDSSFGPNLFSCMSSLDDFDPGYIKLKNLAKALVAVFVAVMVLILILVLVKFVTLKKSKIQKRLPKPLLPKDINNWSCLYIFSKAEIEKAISINNRKKSLGRGSAGEVFEGRLPSGQVVAIKQIKKGNSLDSFTREVAGLSRIRHPNLVSLLGCCIEGDEQYLVLEYCHSGNLADHILRKDTVLTWEKRVKILRDCALGLRYLHNYIDGCIVHRDIKLTNILLTEDLEPKLSDFGLAKMLGMEESKVFTDVRGTIGYMDPEYMSNAKLTCASDIYSFGIVALQLLSGQKVFELDLNASEQLTRKAKGLLSSMVLILILVLVKFVTLKKSKIQKRLPKPLLPKDINNWSCLYIFSKAEIEKAISINNRKKSLGRGSAGEVFEGRLPSGQVVAIKQIKKGNSLDSFTREVAGLSRIRHPNLVSLLGCCIEGDEQYLVLEYCHSGNLADHILAKDVSMGNRPSTDFEDPRLHGNLNRKDFEAILQIAVLCVAKSSRGRPPIDVVFDELEKAWKNTVADMKMRKEIGPSATPQSRSMEVTSL